MGTHEEMDHFSLTFASKWNVRYLQPAAVNQIKIATHTLSAQHFI